jgi:putative transcriptional regulator
MIALPMPNSQPIFLIAVPQLGDPNFVRSVILVLHHDTSGALGLVVNNPTSVPLEKFAQDQSLPCHDDLKSVPVFCGGPVEPHRGWILHNDDGIEERREILPGLFLSGSTDTLRAFLKKGKRSFRLVLGYAGWAPGQLEKEMAEGAWIAAGASARHVLQTDPGETWKSVLREMGIDPANIALGHGIH